MLIKKLDEGKHVMMLGDNELQYIASVIKKSSNGHKVYRELKNYCYQNDLQFKQKELHQFNVGEYDEAIK